MVTSQHLFRLVNFSELPIEQTLPQGTIDIQQSKTPTFSVGTNFML